MTHNQRVLELLSDGEPHSHLELYDLRVIAHSRVAALRKQGHMIECWRADGLHWYRLLSDGLACPPSLPPVAEQPVEELKGSVTGEQIGCVRGDSSPEGRLPANPGAPEQLVLVAA